MATDIVRLEDSLTGEERAALRAAVRSVQAPIMTWQHRRYGSDEVADLLHRPHVAAALAGAIRTSLALSAAPAAAAFLGELVRDTEAPARLRLDAANSVLDRVGFAKAPTLDPYEDHRPLRERSAADLRRLADRLDTELKTVDNVAYEPSEAEQLQELLS